MIFLQYTENCEVIIDYPKIGGEDINYFAEKAIRNIFHANIDLQRGKLISELPLYGIKCIENLQSHCANITSAKKSIYGVIFQKVAHKGGEPEMSYIKIF